MKKVLWTLSALSLMGFGLVGCGDSEEGEACDITTPCAEGLGCFDGICHQAITCGSSQCNADTQRCLEGATTSNGQDTCAPKNTPDCDEGQLHDISDNFLCVSEACDPSTDATCPGYDEGSYKYVQLVDLSAAADANSSKEDPGADIDAIVLFKKGTNAQVLPESVVGYEPAVEGFKNNKDVAGIANDPTAVLTIDSFVGYPSSYAGKCKYFDDDKSSKRPFVSLGGNGGTITVKMKEAIEEGDTLSVLELGGCTLINTADGKEQKAVGKEPVKVQVAVSGDTGASWVVIGTSENAVKETGYQGVFATEIKPGTLK